MYYDLGHDHSNFGWVSMSFCYAKISVLVTWSHGGYVLYDGGALWSHHTKKIGKTLQNCNLRVYLINNHLYVFMDSWVNDGAPQPYFSSCMVDYTLMTDQMTTIFVFQFIRGHVPGDWICYQCSSREGPLVISMKISPNTKNRNFLKTFLQPFVMKFVYYLHLISCLISQ